MNKSQSKQAHVLLQNLESLPEADKVAIALVLRRIYNHSVAMAPTDASRCHWTTENMVILNDEWQAIERVVS